MEILMRFLFLSFRLFLWPENISNSVSVLQAKSIKSADSAVSLILADSFITDLIIFGSILHGSFCHKFANFSMFDIWGEFPVEFSANDRFAEV